MSGPARPLRMCSACTQCHAAKARCTGEKTGCARCRQVGVECVYKISLVGRTSKHGVLRSQRASSTTGSGAAGARHIAATGTSATTNSSRGSRSSPAAQAEPAKKSPSSSQPQIETIHVAAAYGAEDHRPEQQHVSPSCFLDHDLMMDESGFGNMSQDFLFDWEAYPPPPPASSTESRDCNTGTTGCSDSTTLFEGSSDGGRLFAGQDLTLLTSAPTSTAAATAIAMGKPVGAGILARRMAPSQQGGQHSSLHFGEISTATAAAAATAAVADPQNLTRLVSLAEILRVLEASVHWEKHNTPDAIMKTNKLCLADIASLFGSHKPLGNCQSCCLLVTCALDLILILFESILDSLSALDNNSNNNNSSSSNNNDTGTKLGHGHGSHRTPGAAARLLPPVQFGVFEPDPDEQLTMMKCILRSELRHYQHMTNAFSASVTTACPEHLHRVLDEWWEGMRKRLCRLLSAVAV